MCRTANGYDVNWFNDWVIAANKFIAGESVDYNFLSTGQQKDGRGNICPATIILPTLAMEAKKKVKEDQDIIECFMSILDKAITDCKDELIERYNWIGAQDSRSASFMYDNGTMFGYIPQEGIKSALKHGTLAVGQIGLSEALKILIGCDHTTKKGMKVAKQIEQLFKDRCAEFKEKYQLNFGVYYTPRFSGCFVGDNK